ncbi:MAG: outer membrane lipoprotein-sorting protein [Bacteroidales bacterium]|nr:outer membrane lipoprotein-sorting protein [Bacteroidales bacterium]
MKLFHTLPIAAILVCQTGLGQSARDIVQKAHDRMYGENSYAEMEMKVIRPAWDRTIRFKSWSKGTEFSMALITDPAKEEGKTFLKRHDEMWSWRPAINRMIKLPPSMMSQGWMGSDYTNDDLINEASVIEDYTHELIGKDTIGSFVCHKIELTPAKEAAVVWGKIHMWISKENHYELKTQFYDEDEELIKTHLASDVQLMDDRRIPTQFEIIPEKEEDQRTVVRIEDMDFDISLSESFFSQQNMKRVR